MSSLNKVSELGQLLRDKINSVGTPVPAISPEQQLKRLVLASMLWEKQFYLDGKSHAELVGELVAQSSAIAVSNLAIMARDKFKLRHIPLLLTRELARHGKLQASVLNQVVQRAEEMS